MARVAIQARVADLFYIFTFVQNPGYDADYKAGNLQMSFGFVRGGRMSGSWKKLLLKHAAGLDTLYTGSRQELGEKMARIGGRLKKKGDPDAKFFFLKKMTGRRIHLPKRPAIDPFWKSSADDARRNIAKNFRRKMRGERI